MAHRLADGGVHASIDDGSAVRPASDVPIAKATQRNAAKDGRMRDPRQGSRPDSISPASQPSARAARVQRRMKHEQINHDPRLPSSPPGGWSRRWAGVRRFGQFDFIGWGVLFFLVFFPSFPRGLFIGLGGWCGRSGDPSDAMPADQNDVRRSVSFIALTLARSLRWFGNQEEVIPVGGRVGSLVELSEVRVDVCAGGRLAGTTVCSGWQKATGLVCWFHAPVELL